MKIEIEGLGFRYGNVQVLKDINLVIDEPGLFCIVGSNGVGKSTLVKCILGINKYDEGRIRIDGYDVSNLKLREIAKVMGYVPVTSGNVFSMTVIDMVMMGRHPHQRMGTASKLDWKIVKRSLNMMGIKGLSMKDSNEISAGQHQKVGIAKGLAQTPRVLILDEPTSNLDARHQLQVTERLKNLAKEIGMTVIMVSHDLNTSAKYADKIVMMAMPGVIYKVGTPKEILTEETIKNIYGVECRVIDDNERPHVILKRALTDEEIAKMRSE